MKLIEIKPALSITCALFFSSVFSVLYIDVALLKIINTSGMSRLVNRVLDRAMFLESEYFLYLVVLSFFISCLCLYKNKMIAGVIWKFCIYFIVCFLLTWEIKYVLKICFGRYVPTDFFDGVCDGECKNYGFNLFTDLPYYHGSFPSGHCVVVTFCTVWLSCFLGKSSYLIYLIPILMILPLVIANYHFFSDCIAGILVGYLCGVISVRMWMKYN